MTRPTKSLRYRLYSFCSDCSWLWDRHREGFLSGLLGGVLIGIIAAEFWIGI